MFRVMDFVFLSLFVGFVIPAGLPWAIQSIHEQLDPKGVAYEAALVQNQAKTVEARQRYVSMYLSLGVEAANALDSNESPESGSAVRDEVP
ncbi:MAG: hypothetical protein JWN70_4083 [Planctomycetaceae bacterium]|nr:hypothetical protein [Planctomycetaceae bacterium]